MEDADWKSPYMMSWRDEDITTVLDEASALMEATAAHLRCGAPLRFRPPPLPACRPFPPHCHRHHRLAPTKTGT